MFQGQEMNWDEPAQSMGKLYSVPAGEISLIKITGVIRANDTQTLDLNESYP